MNFLCMNVWCRDESSKADRKFEKKLEFYASEFESLFLIICNVMYALFVRDCGI